MYDMLALEIEKQRLALSEASPTALQLDISPQELANMCAIPPAEQYSILELFLKENRVKVIKNRLYVPNCLEIIKHAAYYRKQKATKNK